MRQSARDWLRRFLAALGMTCLLLATGCTRMSSDRSDKPWTFVEGAPVRGDVAKKQIALIFTGGEFGEGSEHILSELARRKIKASFFVTGDFLRQEQLLPHLRRMIADGHYLGPHSDSHPLYCPWEDRSKTLVT
jgi:peptidoglycan/xylan/chitin deacetylase (PgdA/CDA1 family)